MLDNKSATTFEEIKSAANLDIEAIMGGVDSGVSLGVKTPYSVMNSAIGGVHKGEWLNIIGDRKSGNTHIMLNCVLSALESGKSMLLVSTEAMSSLLSMAIQREGFDLALLENLHIVDAYNCVSVDYIFNKAKELGVDGIVIDSIDLLRKDVLVVEEGLESHNDFIHHGLRCLSKKDNLFMFTTCDPTYCGSLDTVRHADITAVVSGFGEYRDIECSGRCFENFNFKINFDLDGCFDLSEVGG